MHINTHNFIADWYSILCVFVFCCHREILWVCKMNKILVKTDYLLWHTWKVMMYFFASFVEWFAYLWHSFIIQYLDFTIKNYEWYNCFSHSWVLNILKRLKTLHRYCITNSNKCVEIVSNCIQCLLYVLSDFLYFIKHKHIWWDVSFSRVITYVWTFSKAVQLAHFYMPKVSAIFHFIWWKLMIDFPAANFW